MLPGALLFGSLGILCHPLLPYTALHAASAAKVAEGGLRFAIDKASMELMWLPVPSKIKEAAKSFVDTVVDRLGTGITGLLWLALAGAGITSNGRLNFVSIVVVAAGVAWVVVLLSARRAYVDAFRDRLITRSLDLDQLTLGLMDAGAKQSVDAALNSDDAREIGFALYLLSEMRGELPDMTRVLTHSDARVRRQVLELLADRCDPRHREAAAPCLFDSAPKVSEAAVVYLRRTAPEGHDAVLDGLPSDAPNYGFVISVIKLASTEGAPEAAKHIRHALSNAPQAERPGLTRLLGCAPADRAAELLRPLLDGKVGDSRLVDAALRASGRAAALPLIPEVCRLLDDRRHRPRAAQALREMGLPAVPDLRRVLAKGSPTVEAKLALLRLLGRSGAPQVSPDLAELLTNKDPRVSLQALRALVRLRSSVRVKVPADRVYQLISGTTRRIYRDLLLLGLGAWPTARSAPTPTSLLERAVLEQVETHISRLFSLLSLLHSPDDIRTAHDGVRSPLRSIRANGIEFLDNVLEQRIKQRLLPLLEDASPSEFVVIARQVMEARPETRDEALLRFLRGPDEWLRAVAAWSVGEERLQPLTRELERLLEGGARSRRSRAVRSRSWGGQWRQIQWH